MNKSLKTPAQPVPEVPNTEQPPRASTLVQVPVGKASSQSEIYNPEWNNQQLQLFMAKVEQEFYQGLITDDHLKSKIRGNSKI